MFEGEKITLSLSSNRGHVGQVVFPGCTGTGQSIVCAGHSTLKGAGKGLAVNFGWFCSPVTGICDPDSRSAMTTPQGKTRAVMTLKTTFDDIKKHSRFKVFVHIRPKG